MKWLPVSEELSIRAILLDEGGPEMWRQFMESCARSTWVFPSARRILTDARARAAASGLSRRHGAETGFVVHAGCLTCRTIAMLFGASFWLGWRCRLSLFGREPRRLQTGGLLTPRGGSGILFRRKPVAKELPRLKCPKCDLRALTRAFGTTAHAYTPTTKWRESAPKLKKARREPGLPT
ncbi:MAG: hypothetical protein WDZ83_14800 [Rhizobiaceae bacterium]